MNTINKIEGFCVSLLSIVALLVLIVFLSCCLSGCSQPRYSDDVKIGVVDSCYTVIEYAPLDSKDRINKYLDTREADGSITKDERRIIDICIERTVTSSKWGGK